MAKTRYAVGTLGLGGLLLAAWFVLFAAEPERERARGTAPDVAVRPEATGPDSLEAAGESVAASRPEVEREESVAEIETPSSGVTLRTAVRGVVLDQQGDPVGGAEVRLGRPLWVSAGAEFFGVPMAPEETRIWVDQATVTDAEGRFLFADPTPGVAHRVRVTTRDRLVGQTVPFDVESRGKVDVGRVVVRPGGGLRGELVEPNGVPVAGVLVFGHDFPARSDAFGRFDLGLLPVGPVDVAIARADWQLVKPPRVMVQPRRVLERRFVARRASHVSGVVVDGAGEGVKGRRVVVRDVAPEASSYGDLKTDLDGAFSTEVPRPGAYRVIVYDDAAEAPLHWTTTRVPDSAGVRFVVHDVVRLHVTGTSVDGGPPVHLTAVAIASTDGRFVGAWASPSHPDCWRGPRGSLYVRPPPRDAPMVRAAARGYWPADAAMPADFAGGAAEVGVVFGEGAAMHVLVRTADDRPVENVRVRVTALGGHTEMQTDGAGRATLRGFPDGRYGVTARTPRGLSMRRDGVQITRGRVDPVVFRLPPTASVTGRAADPDGFPARGVTLSIRGPNGWLETRSKPDGTFLLAAVPVGAYDLFVELEEADRYPFLRLAAVDQAGPRRRVGEFEVVAGEPVDVPITVPWRRAGGLRVQCVGPDGEGFRARLTLVPWADPGTGGDPVRRDGEADLFGGGPDGAIGLPRLAPIRYTVLVARAETPTVRFAGGDVTVTPGKRSERLVRIGRTWSVGGRVVDSVTGAPVAGARLTLHHVHGLDATGSESSSRDGTFRFAGAPEGHLRLRVSSSERRSFERDVLVERATPPVEVRVP